MIKFSILSIKNFLSYGANPTIINLDQPGTTLINGEDLDNTEQGLGGNGVGKTVIINALTYAMYGKPLSNISLDNLINNINKKNMEVSIKFTVYDKPYTIIRNRKTKSGNAGNQVKLYNKDKDITLSSLALTNNYIERITNISYELFIRIITISATNLAFLDLPVSRTSYGSNQTDFIEQLFNLKILSSKSQILKNQIKQTEQSIQMQQYQLTEQNKQIKRHNDQITSIKQKINNWNQSNQRQIVKLKKIISEASNIDIEHQQKLFKSMQQKKQQIKDANNQQHQIEKQIKTTNSLSIKSNQELNILKQAKCPYCLQTLRNNQDKITKCEQIIANNDTQLTKLNNCFNDIKEQINQYNDQYQKIKKQITIDNIDHLINIKTNLTEFKKELQIAQQCNNPFTGILKELQDLPKPVCNKNKLNELNNKLHHQQFLLKLLTKKNSFLRKTLLTKNLPLLNQQLEQYLSDLNLQFSVQFTHEMTAHITHFGRVIDFGNLSNGQRARVNLALSLAFRDILQKLHCSINVCLLDEILDVGLDSIGVQNAARLLKRKSRDDNISLYIISHRDEINNIFDNTITIQKYKQFSQIKQPKNINTSNPVN